VELFAALSAREHLVDRRRETWRIAQRFGAGREGIFVELAVRNESGELEQTAPTRRAVRTSSNSAYCASTDQRSRCRRWSTSLSTAAVTATTIKLATRLVNSA
jgi:hypothetical protein